MQSVAHYIALSAQDGILQRNRIENSSLSGTLSTTEPFIAEPPQELTQLGGFVIATYPPFLRLALRMVIQLHRPVELHFSIHHNGNVAASAEKLHNLFSFARQSRPSRTGLRILFKPAQFVTFKTEIHFAQLRSNRPPNWKIPAFQGDGLGIFDYRLAPHRNQSFF